MSFLTEEEQAHLQQRLNEQIQLRDAFQEDYDNERSSGEKLRIKPKIDALEKEITEIKSKLTSVAPPSPPAPDPWPAFLKQHPLKIAHNKGGILYSVNCNREEHYGEGIEQDFLDVRENKKNLLGFIMACPHQRPLSIAKRLVYEMQHEHNLQMVYFRDAAEEGEAVSMDIPFGLKPEITWANVWDVVQDRIQNAQNAETPLQLSELCGDKHHVVMFFRITAQKWHPNKTAHLQYLIQQFCNLPEDHRKFLVFISLELPHIHSTASDTYQTDVQKIVDLCTEANQADHQSIKIVPYKCLPPVEIRSLENWLNDVSDNGNQATNRRMIAHLEVQNRQYQDETRNNFDMEYVEDMQKAVLNQPRPDLKF
jgi:hypothetical protein